MTRLDQNRAASQLAQKAGVPVGSVTKMTIWGNHSDTQYPDYKNAEIAGVPAPKVITDAAWLQETFIPTVAKCGGAVIKARGDIVCSVGGQRSARHRRAPHVITPPGDWFSAGVVVRRQLWCSHHLIYSFPLVSKASGLWSIVTGLPIDDDAAKRPTPPPPS